MGWNGSGQGPCVGGGLRFPPRWSHQGLCIREMPRQQALQGGLQPSLPLTCEWECLKDASLGPRAHPGLHRGPQLEAPQLSRARGCPSRAGVCPGPVPPLQAEWPGHRPRTTQGWLQEAGLPWGPAHTHPILSIWNCSLGWGRSQAHLRLSSSSYAPCLSLSAPVCGLGTVHTQPPGVVVMGL